MPKTAPYGTWESPITTDAITAESISLSDVIIDPVTSEIYHVEGRPSEAGRSVLVHTKDNRDIVPKDFNVRTGVHEYGGACVDIRDGVAYFSNYTDGRIYKVASGGQTEPITPSDKPYRYADFKINPVNPSLIISVMEDHTINKPAQVVNTLVLVDVQAKTVSPLVSGADFYIAPRFTPDGSRLVWQQWRHPDMPWQGSDIYVAEFDPKTGKLGTATHIAGERTNISVGYPYWSVDGQTLYFLSDEGEPRFQNPWVYKGGVAKKLLSSPLEQEFGAPAWNLGWEFGTPLDASNKRVLFTSIKGGRNVWQIVDTTSGKPQEVESPYVDIVTIRRLADNIIVFIGGKVSEGKSVVVAKIAESGEFSYETLKLSAPPQFSPDLISIPQPITIKVPPNDEPLHIVYYPPTNPAYSGSSIENEKPPCIFSIHGGPTSHASQGLNINAQFFTSRGFGWVDVDYGGSSGYGRVYTDRLNGKWGITDVQDTIESASRVSSPPYSLVDPKRLCIRGGSSGGYTVLAALCDANRPTVFSAGTSMYGISDLLALAQDTHKFESQYPFKLIGGTPEEVPDIYKDRSPINHADRIRSPLLVLQGADDEVVPPAQSELIVETIHNNGGTAEYKLYEGEGHGWRKADTIKDALERELAFYRSTFNLNAQG